jgi:predicted O-methyltransferase YrrM
LERRLAALTAQEPAQAHVRRRLGLPLRDEAALRRVAERYEPPAWAVGSISVHDAMFLYDMVRGVRARRVIEVGVAAGGSTAVLLTALADAGVPMVDGHGEPTLQSFDLHPWCYFDRSRPVGSAVLEMAPELAAGLRLRTRCTAADAGRMWASPREPAELAFIDADHRHPCATADLLALMPALAPGAWVVLHDIRLAEAARREEARNGTPVDWSGQHGAEWLFESWPHEKLTGGTSGAGMGGTNIGAIRLPAPPRGRVTAADLRELISRPWETRPDAPARAALGMG